MPTATAGVCLASFASGNFSRPIHLQHAFALVVGTGLQRVLDSILWHARAFLAAVGARTLLVNVGVARRVEECVEGHANGANTTQAAALNSLQHSSLCSMKCPRSCGQIIVAEKVAVSDEHVREGVGKDGRRFGVHERRPADAKVDGRALKEDGLCGFESLAAIQDDEAEVGAMRIDDGHEQVDRNGHQTVGSEPVLASEDEHVVVVHLRTETQSIMRQVLSRLCLCEVGCLLYHRAALAQEEPCFAVAKGVFELRNVRVVEVDAWKHSLSLGRGVQLDLNTVHAQKSCHRG